MSDARHAEADHANESLRFNNSTELTPSESSQEAAIERNTMQIKIPKTNKRAVCPKKIINNAAEHLPVLVHFAGSDFAALNLRTLTDRIQRTIKEHIDSHPHMALRGRTSDFYRINYDPAAQDVTGVGSRISKLLLTKDDYISLESLLCTLVRANKKAFKDIKLPKLGAKVKLDEASYRSYWIHNQYYLKQISPVSSYRSENIIAVVIDMVRQRCEKVDPTSNLLRNPVDIEHDMLEDNMDADSTDEDYFSFKDMRESLEHICEWSLCSLEFGLATKVRDCFSGPKRFAKEYEDQIERTLYSFK